MSFTPADCWAALRHGGLLISPEVLDATFPQAPPPLNDFLAERLLREVQRVVSPEPDDSAAGDLITTVLEKVCGLRLDQGMYWERGNDVAPRWAFRALSGEVVRPRRVWYTKNNGRLPVFVDDESRLGVGRGRRSVSRVIEWCRTAGEPLALLTNARQWRLMYVGAEHDAWAEWDADLWFPDGVAGPQIAALQLLLNPDTITPPAAGAEARLLQAINRTRQGQSKLSSTLGERARLAVELLIQEHSPYLGELEGTVSNQDVYRAATRMVMRLVVVFFAESRELFPVDDEVFRESYGLGGLFHDLERAGGSGIAAEERLRQRHSAWPRLLSLFRLIFYGSHHERLLLPRYGGELFAPGTPDAADPVSRAVALFETGCFRGTHPVMSDAAVRRMLSLLARCPIRVSQGRGARIVPAPVNFSGLSSEYIGILYEGLLDYELHQGREADPVLFLNLGDQPALPLSCLETLDDRVLPEFLKKFKAKKQLAVGAEEEEAEGAEEEGADAGEGADYPEPDAAIPLAADAVGDAGYGAAVPVGEDVPPPMVLGQTPSSTADPRRVAHERALAWARRAVLRAGLVRRNADSATIDAAAAGLIARVVLPGEHYLVRWGGTRKGQGSFYTRPQLASPTVRRTLEPLCYEYASGGLSVPGFECSRRHRPCVGGAKDGDGGKAAQPNLSLHRDEPGGGGEAKPNGVEVEPPAHLVPRTPDAILRLKVCDPGMGSASFLVSALRYMADALYRSLFHHKWLVPQGEGFGRGPGLPQGEPAWFRECVKDMPATAEQAEDFIRARLKRIVVERCIYGVDIDPLAVELGRLALWIETMDRDLPFGFLDHKLKCGNSLVGCWFDQFAFYPAMAWDREGGDKGHDTFVHHVVMAEATRGANRGQQKPDPEYWTKAISALRGGAVKTALQDMIKGQGTLTAPQALMRKADEVHADFAKAAAEIHDTRILDTDEQAVLYHQRFDGNPTWVELKNRFDAWCALWFWPPDQLGLAPMPGDFLDLRPETLALVAQIAAEGRFFHWELEFPDVFAETGGGFDALLGNPPWNTLQPESKEFFSNFDPLYRAYGKQEALRRQKELFEQDAQTEDAWLRYRAGFKAMANWMGSTAVPFGDRVTTGSDGKQSHDFGLGGGRDSFRNSEILHARWRQAREGAASFADSAHSFRCQGGGKPYTFRLFLEQSHALLRHGGRLGFLVPSGVYTDKGATALRSLFLDHCRWEWLFGFENRNKIFDIDERFKFCPLIIEKGGSTRAIRAAFMHREMADWERAEEFALDYPRERIEEFSPHSKAILELRTPRDLEVLQKMYAHGVLLGDQGPDGWGIRYQQGDFNMTSDSKLFSPRPRWEAQEYVPDEYGHWLNGNWQPYVAPSTPGPRPLSLSVLARSDGLILSRDGTQAIRIEDIDDVALPLYEGRMIDQFDFSAKGWVSGKGRSAVWREIPWENKVIEPQFLMDRNVQQENVLKRHLEMCRREHGEEEAQKEQDRLQKPEYREQCLEHLGDKVAIMDIGSATNARTMYSTPHAYAPFGHTAPVLRDVLQDLVGNLTAASVWNTFAYDHLLRQRLGGLHLTWHYLEETAVPSLDRVRCPVLPVYAARLAFGSSVFACEWARLQTVASMSSVSDTAWYLSWALTPQERLRLRCILDAVVAELYGLDVTDFAWILRDCDHPVAQATNNAFARVLDPKGFWRVDKAQPPERRHTVLAQVAFQELKKLGLDAFLALNNGDGWMLPDTLCLADYGLGHDERARTPQPVVAALGPRFLDWQLAISPEDSWAACRRHADNIRRIRAVGIDQSPVGSGREVRDGEVAYGEPGKTEPSETEPASPPSPAAAGPATDLLGNSIDTDLFGAPIKTDKRRRK